MKKSQEHNFKQFQFNNHNIQNPVPTDETSTFGDSSCGEPLVPQHLVVDFTSKDKDTDFIQKKICSFWDFIHSCPEIRHLEVFPEQALESEPKSESVSSCSEFGPEKSIPLEKTAISMLEFVEGEDLFNCTFEEKQPRSACTLGSRDYIEGTKTNKSVAACPCDVPCLVTCPMKFTPAAKELNQTMTAWDMKHPKCMKPPGHPPSLQHAVMQRFNEPPKPVDSKSLLLQ